jgi:hypothetical protein
MRNSAAKGVEFRGMNIMLRSAVAGLTVQLRYWRSIEHSLTIILISPERRGRLHAVKQRV